MSGLREAFDEIAADVPVYGDLDRAIEQAAQERRRHYGVVAGLAAAAAVVAVIVGVITVIPDGKDSPRPVDRPTTNATSEPAPDSLALTEPLVAPTSLLDVRALGFHVEPVPGLGAHHTGWSLREQSQSVELDWDHMALGVSVTVYYQGVDPAVEGMPPGDDVAVHGVPGQYYAAPEPEPGDGWGAQLVWEYAEDSYATVTTGSGGRGNPDLKLVRSTLVKVAEAVRPDGQPVRLPIRFGAIPSSLPDPTNAVLISSGTGDGGWDVRLFQGGLGILVGTAGGPADYSEDVQVRVGDTVRSALVDDAEGTAAYPIADLKRMLREITAAPSKDETTWFDLRTALGG